MADLFDNPMGLAGFEFVEFTAPEKGIIEPVPWRTPIRTRIAEEVIRGAVEEGAAWS